MSNNATRLNAQKFERHEFMESLIVLRSDNPKAFRSLSTGLRLALDQYERLKRRAELPEQRAA